MYSYLFKVIDFAAEGTSGHVMAAILDLYGVHAELAWEPLELPAVDEVTAHVVTHWSSVWQRA